MTNAPESMKRPIEHRRHSRRGFTDLAGQFDIPALANSDLDLEYHPPEGPITYAKRIKTAHEPVRGLEIRLDPGGELQVLVLTPDRKPLKEAHVILIRRTYWSGPRISGNGMSQAEMKRSSDDGTALFKDLNSTYAQLEPRLERASVDIEATHPDYDPAEENGIRIEPATVNHLELTLLPRDTSAEIDGVVRDTDGHPIEGVHVQVYGFSNFKTAATGPLGYFQFKDLRPGDYSLQFNHPNYRWVYKRITAPQLDIEVQMQKP